MISKTIGFRGTKHFQTHPYAKPAPGFFLKGHAEKIGGRKNWVSQQEHYKIGIINPVNSTWNPKSAKSYSPIGTSSSRPNPYAPCMEYLPTFALEITQMLVNIPYMENMGKSWNFVSHASSLYGANYLLTFSPKMTPLFRHIFHVVVGWE